MNFKLILAATAAAITFGASAQCASISATTPDGRSVRVTAITPYIIRVDNTAPGEKPAPVQSVLDLSPAQGIATVNAAGTALHTAGGITATVDSKGVLTLASQAPGTSVVDYGMRTAPTALTPSRSAPPPQARSTAPANEDTHTDSTATPW